MSEGRGAAGCLKLGCLGVVAVVGLVLLVAGAFLGTAYMQVKGEQVEERQSAQELPPLSQASASETPDQAAQRQASEDAPGRIVLDLSSGDFEINAGPPGEPIRVEARYDTKSFSLDETLTSAESGGWEYRLGFGPRGTGGWGGLRQLLGGNTPEVRITLPRGTPISLEGRFRQGAAKMDLGGMWIDTIDLDQEKGALELIFSEPLEQPVERLRIRGSMGAVMATAVGNASPRSLSFDHSMGGVELDLRGQWVTDSDVSVTMSMGGGAIRLPTGVNVQGLSADFQRFNRQAEIDLPTLNFSLSSSMGEVAVYE